MRIGIDLMSFRPGVMGGSEVHMRSLLSKLQESDRRNNYFLLLNSSNRNSVSMGAHNFGKAIIPTASHSFVLRNLPLLNNAPLLRRFIEPLCLDVMHRPFTVVFPRLKGVREVVTIADLQFEELTENFTSLQLYSRRRLYRRSALEADAIIAVSKFTKRDISEKYGVEPGKIHVIYEAAGEEYGEKINAAAKKRMLSDLGIDFDYVYYPSAAWRHKNHVRLFEAMKLLRGSGLKLVLSGLGGHMHELRAKVREMGLEKSVKVLGHVDKSYLPALYQGATVMAFPSLYEGFGLPLVEAMASGCPVACAKAGSIAEVCGNAAEYFDPHSPEDIAEKIERVAADGKLRKRLIAAGRKQSAKFSWKKCAKETLKVFEKAAGE